MWTTLRAEMVYHIINGCEDILSLAKQIVPHVMDYENYALSIADIHDANLWRKKGWKRSEVLNTVYNRPVPEGLGEPRVNRWSLSIWFGYNPKNELLYPKHSHSPYNGIPSYTNGMQVYNVLRKGTSRADLGSFPLQAKGQGWYLPCQNKTSSHVRAGGQLGQPKGPLRCICLHERSKVQRL